MPIKPFTQKDLEIIRKGIELCMETKEYLKRCIPCKINVDKENSENEAQLAFFQSVKDQFFPKEP